MRTRIEEILPYTKKMNLLYVEDDSRNRKNITKFLSMIFENIIIAVDGEDGLNKFKNNNIDLVITDIKMPKLNGIEMIKEIKKLDNNCRIIFLSAHDDKDTLLECISLQGEGFLVKPTKIEDIVTLVEEIVRKQINLQSKIV